MGDQRDLLGGALLVAAGGFIAVYASQTLALGTVRRMGPGMFPFWIGLLMALLGVAIFIGGLLREGRIPEVEWRSGAAVLAAFASFGLLITPFGLVPAVVGLVAVSSLAEQRLKPISAAALSVILPLLAWTIFKLGLGLPLTMVRWPF